jgi:nucleoside-diphosphate-sugar epimerase
MKLNIFGPTGFIGKRFCELNSNCILNDRNDYAASGDDIVYFSGLVDNSAIHTDPLKYVESNISILIKTLETCKNKKLTFNYISSYFVYGEIHGCIDEDYPCNPETFYSISKRSAEQFLISFCKTFNINYRIIRISNVIGKNDTRASCKKNVLQFLLNKIKQNENITLHNFGLYYRDYIHIDDCINGLNLIINNGNLNCIYNLGSGNSTLVHDIIYFAKNKLNSKSKIQINFDENFNLSKVKNGYLNIEKIKKMGFECKYNIYEIIEEMISENNI